VCCELRVQELATQKTQPKKFDTFKISRKGKKLKRWILGKV
jgi:hypothetical protein